MFGGMKGVKDSHYQFTDDAPIAGEYNLDVYVNNKWRGKYDLTVKEQPGKAACHTPSCSSSVLKPRGWTKDLAQCITLRGCAGGNIILISPP
jgi:outer membrane usher protein